MKNKIRTDFTLKEVYNYLNGQSTFTGIIGILSEDDFINDIIFDNYTDIVFNFKNIFDYDSVEDEYHLQPHIFDLLNGLLARYQDEYVTYETIPYKPWDREIPTLSPENAQKTFWMILQYLNNVAPKYTKLLTLYKNAENKLMDKLETKVLAGASTKGSTHFNDTPQEQPASFDEFEDADYTTNITISKSDTDSDSTTTFDDKNIMARLTEIQDAYQNVMYKFIGEFDKFFWTEDDL